MRNRSTIPIMLAATTLLALGAVTPVLAQKGPGDPEPPITLRLLVQDSPGRQSEPAALDLARLADEISGGAITIVPSFDGGDVASAVMTGEAELGMVPSRDWGAVGVTSLDVLEAPFLIDNDALALAVATGDIADRAMAGLEAVGVTGLSMWPEDLRHLFAMDPSGADFSTPAGLADADIAVVAGIPGHDLITTLGGRIYAEYEAVGDLTGDRVTDAHAGVLEGMVTGLWGAGLPTDDVTVAGDLPVYAKYQILVGNAGSLGRLTEQQRAYLDEIVAAAHAAALARHFTQAELAARLCERGGRVISVGAAAADAFKTAARPLTEALAADPVTGELMAAVEALRAEVPASPDAGTCEPGQAATPEYPVSDLTGTFGSLPPAGSYRADVTYEDLVARGADPDWAGENAGLMTWTFDDGRVSTTVDGPAGMTCTGTAASQDGAHIYLDTPSDGPCSLDFSIVWRPQPTGIEIVLVPAGWEGTVAEFGDLQAHIERLWTRLDGPMPSITPAELASELPAPGMWRISHTIESLVEMGVSAQRAPQIAGSVTMTLDGTRWDFIHSTKDGDFACGGTYALDGSDLVLTFEINPQDCGTAPVYLRWIATGPDTAAVREVDHIEIFNGEWTRIGDAGASPDPGAFIGDRPVPPGTYRITVTTDDIEVAGATRDFAGLNAGIWTWTFTDDGWSATHDVRDERCAGGMTVSGDHVELSDTPDGTCGLGYDLRWRLAGDGIEFELVGLNWPSTPEMLASERAFIERVWTRIADAPASPAPAAFIGDALPPDGVYRVELTEADLIARGADPSYAAANVGIWTSTQVGPRWTMTYSRTGAECSGDAAIVGDVIRWTDDPVESGCVGAGDWRWRPAGDGIETQFVPSGGESPEDLANYRAFNDRVWVRIGDAPAMP